MKKLYNWYGMQAKIKISDLRRVIKTLSDVRLVGLIMFGVVAVLVAWSSLKTLQVNYELQKKEAVLRQKNTNQKLSNENLKLKNTYLETDEYLELTARRQFNKAAPGEKLYLIPEEVALSKTAELPLDQPETKEELDKSKPKYQQNFEAWLDFLLQRN
ncbi:septum formation initiator family protein [Candidatus Parcubacteria bacterium]|nr:septum formation initiator family protein [Candidatus Parcubacteria bacterium]